MPELPEVETMRRGISPIVGGRIAAVEVLRGKNRPIAILPSVKTFERSLVDARIAELGRVGKRVILILDRGQRVVLEPRMTGLVLLADPPTSDHVRLRFLLKDCAAPELLFWDRRGLGSAAVWDADEFAARLGNGRIGPDALEITAETLCERLSTTRRPVKAALLDQQRVAGIGNLYASEILYQAAIHPATPCDKLSLDEWERIAAATRHILAEAIRYEGSTLSDGTYRNALNQSGSYQNHHRVYDRADEPCPGCRQPIVRIVQAQRSTFFCPACQPARRRRGTRTRQLRKPGA